MSDPRSRAGPQRSARMVKPGRSLYNALALAAVLALTAGCGKPTPPPPGAETDTTPADVELGAESNSPPPGIGEPTRSSSADEKPPADDSGAK